MDEELIKEILIAINNGEDKVFTDFGVDKQKMGKHVDFIKDEGLATGVYGQRASNKYVFSSIKNGKITMLGLDYIK